MYHLLFSFIFFCIPFTNAQEIGEIKEMKMILADIPFSGDAIQPNFIIPNSNEIYSFNHTTWLDKHFPLLDFFNTYKDSCRDNTLGFTVTMIYIPMEVYNHVRYEGYVNTEVKENLWVLTSILRTEGETG